MSDLADCSVAMEVANAVTGDPPCSAEGIVLAHDRKQSVRAYWRRLAMRSSAQTARWTTGAKDSR
jgi:hypothetical protein